MKNKSFAFFSLLVILILFWVFSGTTFGDDWTAWRGPNTNGISTETGWNPRALTTPKIVWKTNVGKGHSSVAVKGNYLYTMGNNPITSGNTTIDKDIVICLDNRTGKKIWLYAYPCDRGVYPGPMSTPVVDGTCLYTISRKGHLFCFNALNGKVVWKKNIITDGLSQSLNSEFSFSPVIEGNMLLLNLNTSGVVLNKKNGKVIWKSSPGEGGIATPILFNFGGKRLAVIQGKDTIHIVDINTGEVWRTFEWKSFADPILFNQDLIYLSASRSLTKKSCALIKIRNWELEVLWYEKYKNTAFQSWVILNGYGYGFKRSDKQYLQCIEIMTGKQKWEHQVVDWGSLMAANGKLIILYGQGDLSIAEASSVGYKEISSAKLFDIGHWRSYQKGDVNCCWTAPVLSNGRIYCRNTYGDLVCVDMK